MHLVPDGDVHLEKDEAGREVSQVVSNVAVETKGRRRSHGENDI